MAKTIQRTANRPLQSPRVILCEGADEYDILCWLRAQRGLGEPDVEIQNAEGRGNLLHSLGDLRYQSGGGDVRLVLVVLDSEDCAQADQQLLRDLKLPDAEQPFRVITRVLPNEGTPGALESLVRRCVDQKAAAFACADAWEACQAQSEVACRTEDACRTQAQKDKAWVHVWLAAHGDIYSRVGYAMKRSAEVRERLQGVVAYFEQMLDQLLEESLS